MDFSYLRVQCPPMMGENDSDRVQAFLRALNAELNIGYKRLSEVANKNASYIQQFATRGSPRRLPEDVRSAIAAELQIPEGWFKDGPPENWRQLIAETYQDEQQKGLQSATSASQSGVELAGGANQSGQPADAYAQIPLKADQDLSNVGPIYASAEGGDGDMTLDVSDVVEHRPKPIRHANVAGLYGFYVIGDSMAPRINPGEMVWVHPSRKPAIGQDCVFIERGKSTADTRVLVKQFAGRTSKIFRYRQFNPDEEGKLPAEKWDVQLIVDIDLNR